jgi:predicted DCC family thiol-disulfide oxidoreductase YuxK
MIAERRSHSKKRAFIALIAICLLKFSELYLLQILERKIDTFATLLFIFATVSGIFLIRKLSVRNVIFFGCLLLLYILLDYSRSSHYSLLILLYFVFALDYFIKFKAQDFTSLLNFSLALVYFFGFLNKLNMGFLSGFVIYNHSVLYGLFNKQGFDTIVSISLILASVIVVTFELIISILLFTNRVSPYVLSMAIFFHLSIILFMHEFSVVNIFELVVFNLTCIIFLTLNFANGNSPAFLVIWDENCSFCKSTIQLIKKIDFLDKIQFIPNSDTGTLVRYGITVEQSEEAMQVVDTSENVVYSGFYGFRQITLVLPPFGALFLLMSIPFVEHIGVKTYRRIAQRRSCKLM